MISRITRRQVLQSSQGLIALPFLESLGRKASASTALPGPPKRLVFLGFGWGVTNETWFPDVARTGAEWELSEGLRPLARHQRDLTVIQGCSNKFANEAHWGSTFWLTGANRYAEPGQSFHNSVSVDQVAAAHLGRPTRLPSIQLSSSDAEGSGHGPGLSLAWNHKGKPLAGWDNPVVAFKQLFSPNDVPLEQSQALLRQKRSVLDTLMADAKRVHAGLSAADGDKLDEYLQGIRDIETRLGKEEQWLGVPKANPGMGEPAPGLGGADEIRVMYDLIVAALRTDVTRVVTYRQPVQSLISSLGINVGPHDMSHYLPGDRMAASQKRDVAQSELLAGLLDALKNTKEADGSSLLDHTCLVFGSNIRSIHYLDNCPTIIAGGGAGLKLGHHLVLPKDTPLCNVWLTILHGLGLDPNTVVRHGDSTGVVRELMA
jgi:hypothetical protein